MEPRIILSLVICCLGLSAQAPLAFTDVTATAGLNWVQSDTGQLLAAGAAFLDYDGDGWDDILVSGGTAPPGLFRNLGNGAFADVTAATGLEIVPAGYEIVGLATADYDNDGDTDLFCACDGFDILYRNDGGVFTDVTATAFVAGPGYWGTGAAWGDYDADGDLDLYVGNYVGIIQYPNHTPDPNLFYRNEGDGTFSDLSFQFGLQGAGTTLAVSWTDFDGDGDADLMVANDFGSTVQRNRLYRNDGPGGVSGWLFTEVSGSLGADLAIFAMGIAPGDYDRDLDLDYYYSNLGRNVLLQNNLPGAFLDVTTAAGVEYTYHPYAPGLFATSWGVGFHDFDQDGWLDLWVTNGYIPSASAIANGVSTPNGLYHHDGSSLTFTSVGASAGIEDIRIGRAAAFSDFDRDGDIDVLVNNVGHFPLLYRNDTPNPGRWLRGRTYGRISNRDGQGARVRIDAGGVSQVREVNANYSFESSSERTVHFGLGSATAVDRIEVRWPSGIRHRYHHLPTNFVVPLVEPVVTVDPASSAPTTVQQGTVATFTLVIHNETPTPQTAQHLAVARIAGFEIPLGLWTSSVPPNATTTFPLSIPIPPGIVTGPPIPVELLWTLFDPAAGVDQWKLDLHITT